MSTPEMIDERVERNHLSALRQVGPLDTSPEKLDEAMQRELVLQAIGEKYGTLDGIKRRVGFPMWFDMTELLAGMTVDYLIRRETKGDLTAYFRFEDKPLRFWRIGDCRIDFEKDSNFVVRDEAAKAEEMSKWSIKPDASGKPSAVSSEPDEDNDEDLEPIGMPGDPFETKVPAAQNGASSEVAKSATPARQRGPYKKAAPIDRTLLLKLAETKENTKAISAGLGISQSFLYAEFAKDKTLRDIYDRGRKEYARSQGHEVQDIGGRPRKDAEPVAVKPETPRKINYPKARKSPAGTKSPDIDVDEVERLAREGKTAKEAAAFFGIELYQFMNRLSGKSEATKQIRDAWYRGRQGRASTPASNKSKPAPKAVREPVRRAVKAKPEPEVVDHIQVGEAPPAVAAETTSTETLGNVHVAVDRLGRLHDIAEDLSFNVGTAFLHLAEDEFDAAMFYLQREQARRVRAAA